MEYKACCGMFDSVWKLSLIHILGRFFKNNQAMKGTNSTFIEVRNEQLEGTVYLRLRFWIKKYAKFNRPAMIPDVYKRQG